MKQLTDIELKKASILDLTDDIELIKKVLEDDFFSKDFKFSEQGRISSLISFAEYMNDVEFKNRIKNVCKDTWEQCFSNR